MKWTCQSFSPAPCHPWPPATVSCWTLTGPAVSWRHAWKDFREKLVSFWSRCLGAPGRTVYTGWDHYKRTSATKIARVQMLDFSLCPRLARCSTFQSQWHVFNISDSSLHPTCTHVNLLRALQRSSSSVFLLIFVLETTDAPIHRLVDRHRQIRRHSAVAEADCLTVCVCKCV